MRTPTAALTWEVWRLTRGSVAGQMSFIIIGGSIALIVAPAFGADERMAIGVWFVSAYLCIHSSLWTRKIDDRYGFPLRLAYTRPVPTWLIVGIPMAYLGFSCAMTYILPIAALRIVFGIPFPLAPVAALVAATALVLAASYWWTDNNTVRYTGWAAVMGGVILVYLKLRPEQVSGEKLTPNQWADMFGFSLGDYGLIALVGAVAVGVTLVGVERQRRGEDLFSIRFSTALGWMRDLFSVRCPVSSGARAQIWYDMKSSGVEVLATGVAAAAGVAILLPLAVAYNSEYLFSFAVLAIFAPLLAGLRSGLGIRRNFGVVYMSPFDAARPLGTARLVWTRVLMTAACTLVAWSMIATSAWATLTLLGTEEALSAITPGGATHDYSEDIEEIKQAVLSDFAAQPGYRIAIWMLFAVIQLTAAVAFAATIHAFFVLNTKRTVQCLLALGAYCLLILVAAARNWIPPSFPEVELHVAMFVVAVTLATIFVLRASAANGILTPRQITIAILLWAGYAVACFVPAWSELVLLESWSVRFVLDIAIWYTFAVLPLAAFAMAPWSFGLVRHR